MNKIITLKDLTVFQNYKCVEFESLNDLEEVVGDTIIGKLTVKISLKDAEANFLEDLENYVEDNLPEDIYERCNEANINTSDLELSTIKIPSSVKEYQLDYYFPLKQEFKGLYYVQSTKPDYTSDLERLSKKVYKMLEDKLKTHEEESLALETEKIENQKELTKLTEEYKSKYAEAPNATQKKSIVKKFKTLANSKFGKIFLNEDHAEFYLMGEMDL